LETIETIYPRLKRRAPGPQGIKDLSIFLINHRHKGNSHSCYLNFWQVTISLSPIIIQLINLHRLPAWILSCIRLGRIAPPNPAFDGDVSGIAI